MLSMVVHPGLRHVDAWTNARTLLTCISLDNEDPRLKRGTL